MRTLPSLISITVLLALAGCANDGDDPSPAPESFVPGKNRFVLTVEGRERVYWVHVPASYTGATDVPVVVMLHGTNQTGEQFYNISGWKEVGEAEGILTVFPTALVNCIVDEGQTEELTKWNSYPGTGGWEHCPGATPANDELFLRGVLADLDARLAIDSARVYVVGFSNGGEMAARCAVALSDLFAASIACGGGGALPGSGAGTPIRLLPVLLQFGNADAKLMRAVGATSPLPMDFTELFSTYPGLYGRVPKPYIDTFAIDEASVTVSGDSTSFVVADYVGLSGDPANVFTLVEVKGLEHEYPNTINHPLNGAALHWAWLRRFSLP
ncbi:MAG: hypothetical protein IT349_15525 [Candidatus Eisenbacteria bacterium]|nr:hypothetical protein [Candidatus Eisenbacteria bacterium]